MTRPPEAATGSPDADTAPERPGIERLLAVMARLRHPETGCPWDLEQTFATIAPHTIEEAYEVADAIENGTLTDLKEELGDLLFQVVYYAQMARESGDFAFEDVAHAIADKMIARHPHVFGDARVRSATEMTDRWETQKAAERAAKGAADSFGGGDGETALSGPSSALDGIPVGLPGLTRAVKLQKRAARVGFDWQEAPPILAKIAEEHGELATAMQDGSDLETVGAELGDLLFSVVNLARHLAIDPEQAMRRANAKFERRFRAMESTLAADGTDPRSLSLEALEDLWQRVKAEER